MAATDSIDFPGPRPPDFSDFIYYSVSMSTTFSSADVQLIDRPARRLAITQSVIAFAYSTIIVAVFASLLTTLLAAR